MLRFYLLRHAKSSWAEPGQPDVERGLNERGLNDLPRIAAAMRERDYLPGHVYCSPTLRTRLTLHGIMPAFNEPPNVDYVDALYENGVAGYFDCLRQHATGSSVMIIGHNPMCEAFAATLAGAGAPEALKRMSAKFPTGALAVFDIDLDNWADVDSGSGYLIDFLVPRDL